MSDYKAEEQGVMNPNSTSSVKIKKSSNIFSTLVRKARRKKAISKGNSDEIKNLHVSSQNLSASSTVSLATHLEEEVELSCQNYEKKCSQNQEMLWEGKNLGSETNTSNNSERSSHKAGRINVGLRDAHSCKQLLRDDTVRTNQDKYQDSHQTSKDIRLAPPSMNDTSQEEAVWTSFIAFEKPNLEITHADALQYLNEIINNFHESENHIIHLLVKYITDLDVQNDLKHALCNYAKLQWEAEKRSCSLANDIWVQQLEIGRAQEKILQGTINAIVKQNRQLQIENESLYRKYEKANNLLKGYSDRNKFQDCDAHLESVLRRNEKLQIKLESLFKKNESLERELMIFQKQNDNMEEQLRTSATKIQQMKGVIHKLKTDYEIENISLKFKLDSKDQIIKEAFEIGNVLLQDMEVIKKQLKNFPLSQNWTQLKIKENSLTDMIHLYRSCINEMHEELINIYSENNLKDKDITILRETSKNMEDNFKASLAELDHMTKRVEKLEIVTKEKDILAQKLSLIEEESQRLKSHYEEEKSKLLQSVLGSEKYMKELKEKDRLIEETKLFVANITSEKYSLQNEIAVLHKFIEESGAGDIAKEIEIKHEELDHLKMELIKLKNDNTELQVKLQSKQTENITLRTSQEMTYKTLQRQAKELEKLNEDFQNQRQRAETEHQTVLSLQGQRMKYLEENNILKSIVQHLKGELPKIRELERNLTNISQENSKLGLIAEHNKQHGEKLKQEILYRDDTIAQLKSSLQKLNDIQMQNAKEKMSLYYELNEVSQLKEKLSEVLNVEVKKNAELGQSKEALAKSVNSQMQKIEEKQKNERNAIKILLRDIKISTEEKENALKEKRNIEMEMEKLTVKLADQNDKCHNATKDVLLKNEEIRELRKEVDRYEIKHKEISDKMESEAHKYDSNVKHLKKLIEQLREDKKDLENSNRYLKTNMEKLQKDLDVSRQTEKYTTDALNKIKVELDEARKLLREETELARSLGQEKDKITEEKYQLLAEKNSLLKEAECLHTLMDKIVIDFEKNIKTSEDKENMFKEELNEAKHVLYNYGLEIQDLKKCIELKEKRIEELKDMGKTDMLHEKRYNNLKEEMDYLQKDCEKLKELKNNLEMQLSDLQEEHDKLSVHLTSLEKDADVLESQLKMVLDQKEDDYVFYKKHIAELTKAREQVDEENQKEITKLRMELKDTHNKLINEKAAYETLSQIHKEVSAKFMKSIKDLVDVKNSKHDVLERIKEDKFTLITMEKEKIELQKKLDELSGKFDEANRQIEHLLDDKTNLEKNYSTALDKCCLLENQIKQMEIDHHQQRDVKATVESENQIEVLKSRLEEKSSTIHELKMKIAELQNQMTLLEMEKSEIVNQLQETERKLETEKNLREQLKNTQKLLLAAILQLRDEGKVDSSDCIHLLHMVRSSSHFSVEGTRSEV